MFGNKVGMPCVSTIHPCAGQTDEHSPSRLIQPEHLDQWILQRYCTRSATWRSTSSIFTPAPPGLPTSPSSGVHVIPDDRLLPRSSSNTSAATPYLALSQPQTESVMRELRFQSGRF